MTSSSSMLSPLSAYFFFFLFSFLFFFLERCELCRRDEAPYQWPLSLSLSLGVALYLYSIHADVRYVDDVVITLFIDTPQALSCSAR